jgi:hypothetical protein
MCGLLLVNAQVARQPAHSGSKGDAQDDIVAFRDRALHFDPLARIFAGHAFEVGDERFFSVGNRRIVLCAAAPGVPRDRVRGPALVEDQVVERDRRRFVGLEALVHAAIIGGLCVV